MNRDSVKFGCRLFLRSQEPFTRIIDRGRFCERYGFDSVLVDDHLLYGTSEATAPDPFTTLAALARSTRKITLGVAVTDLTRRHPAIVAQTSATLHSIANGRFFLGLGSGDSMNQSPFGLPSGNSFSRLKEGISVIQMLWKSSIDKPVNYQGKFFELAEAYLQAGTVPPVYLAALGDRMLRLAGEVADGWVPHCHTPITYASDFQKIKSAGSRVGRRLSSFVPCYYTLASSSSKSGLAERRVLGPSKYFLALIPEGLRKVDPDAYHPGRVWEKEAHPKAQRDMIRKIAATIPDETGLKIAIHGLPDDCIEQISNYRKAGCEHFMLTFVPDGGLWSTEGLLSQIRFFASKVVSYFRD